MRARERLLTPTGAIRAWPTVFLSVIGVALAFIFTIAYVNQVDQRRVDGERRAAAERATAAVESKAAVCALILANVQAYAESPPSTPAGKNLAEAWTVLRVRFGC